MQSSISKRVYDALFCINCGAAVGCAIGASVIPDLVAPALWFTIAAACLYVASKRAA
jgi:hypothetical protein